MPVGMSLIFAIIAMCGAIAVKSLDQPRYALTDEPCCNKRLVIVQGSK